MKMILVAAVAFATLAVPMTTIGRAPVIAPVQLVTLADFEPELHEWVCLTDAECSAHGTAASAELARLEEFWHFIDEH